MSPARQPRNPQPGTVAQARAMLLQDDEAGTAQIGAPETEFLTALIEAGEAVVGLVAGYLYGPDQAGLDPEIACFAQHVAVKVSGEITRMQLWLQAPLSAGPDAD